MTSVPLTITVYLLTFMLHIQRCAVEMSYRSSSISSEDFMVLLSPGSHILEVYLKKAINTFFQPFPIHNHSIISC